jgi:hypothetical protein
VRLESALGSVTTRPRRLSFSTTASSPRGTGGVSGRRGDGGGAVGKRVGRALQALQYEESRGHIDVRGRASLFSEYAARELTQLADALPPGGGRERWQGAVAGGFSRYRALSPPQRALLVSEAQRLLAGAGVGAGQPAARAGAASAPAAAVFSQPTPATFHPHPAAAKPQAPAPASAVAVAGAAAAAAAAAAAPAARRLVQRAAPAQSQRATPAQRPAPPGAEAAAGFWQQELTAGAGAYTRSLLSST